MKLKKRTRKQLLRLVAMMLFVAMIINSTASTHASDNLFGRNEVSLSEDAGTQDNIMPANMPELIEGLETDSTEEPEFEPEQSSEQDTESAETPAESNAGVNTDEDMPSDKADAAPGSEPSESTAPEATASTAPNEEPAVSPDTELGERVISSTASDNAVVKIDGLLPEGATISVHPTEVDLMSQRQEVLAAYDITILDKDEQEYKVTNSVTVTISGISILQNIAAKNVNIYHMENEYAKAERISSVPVSGDSVTFTADSFSIYAVTVDNMMNLADEDGAVVVGETKGLEDLITSVEVQGGVPEGGFERDASLTFKFSYAIPADKLDEYKAAPYWTYSISELLNGENAIFKEILAGGTGKIYEGSREVGYYVIDTDNDEVRFYVTDKSWFDDKTDGVEGTFYLACELDSSAVGTKKSEDVEFGNYKVTLNFKEPSVQSQKVVDYWATDRGTVYRKEGDKIRYDITVKPNSDLTELILEDNLGKYQTLVDNTVKITASDGSCYEIPVDDVHVDENGKFTLDLADILGEIKANVTYTITYETTVTDDGWGKEQVNTAQWTWKGKDGPEQKTEENKTTITVVKSSSSKKYEKSEPVVDANGRKSYIFTYTLTVGEEGADLSGYKIKDIISKNQILQGDKIEIRDKDGGLLTSITPNNPVGENGVLFEYTFPEGSKNGPYTITYTTTSDNENYIGNQNVTNTLVTEKDGVAETPSTGDWVDFGGEKEKPQIEKVFSEHDEANKRVWWTITVKVPEGTTIHDAKITETDFKYYLYDQYGNQDNQDGYGMGINMSLADITYLSGGKVDESQYDINYQDNTIIFEELTQSIVIRIPTTYKSLPDGRTIGFYNKVELHEGETYLDSDDDTHKVDNFLYPLAKSHVNYNPQTGIVQWKIVIDARNMDFSDETLPYYLVDTIPKGMEYIEGSFRADGNSYSYNGAWPSWPGKWESGIFIYDEKNAPKVEGQTFILELPGGLNHAYYELYYETKVLDNSTLDSKTYTNTAELQDSEGETLVQAQDSVTVEHKEEDILDKRVASYLEGTDRIDYVIEVNKEGLNLSDDDTLTLEDRIPDGTELVIDQGKVFQAFDADGEPISLSYRYVNRVLTIIIPDETHVTIKYAILIKELGTGQNIVNTVTLRGKKIFSDSDSGSYNANSHGSTLTGTEGTITFNKYDDQMNPLDGAEFAVYEVSYDAQTGKISDFNGTMVGESGKTANGGKLVLGGLSAGKLYYWKETKAPARYNPDTEKHYFAIYNSDGSGNAENSVTRQQLKDIIALIKSANSEMQNIYIEMADKAIWVTAGNEYNGGELGSLTVKKSFTGENLTPEQKNAITFTVIGPDGEIDSFTYAEMPEEGKKYDNLPAGKYTVTEINDNVNGYVHDVTYEVNGSEVSAPEGYVSDGNETTIEIINDYQLQKGNLKVTKGFAGLSEEIWKNLTDEQKKAITFTVTDSQGNEVAKFSYYEMENGSITIRDLAAGEKYTVKEDGHAEILGYVFVTETYNEGNTTGKKPNGLEVTVTAGGTAEVTVTNHYEELGKLTVTKTIDGIDGEVAGLTFEITGPMESTSPETRKVTYADMTGKGKTRSKTFENLPAGTYKVTEINANVEGYSVTTTYYVGNEKVDSVDNVAVDNGKTTVVDITNDYTQLFGKLTLTKLINGLVLSELTEEDIAKLGIQFTIVGFDSNNKKIYEETIFYNDSERGWKPTENGIGKTITINNLPYGRYTVTETWASLKGYVIFASYVIDRGASSEAEKDGNVKVDLTIGEGADERDIVFTNAYSALGELTLTKTFTFDNIPTAAEQSKLKDGIEFTVTGPMEAEVGKRLSRTIKLDEMTYNEATGVYEYKGEKLQNLPYGTYTITESSQSLGENYSRTVEIVVGENSKDGPSVDVKLERGAQGKDVEINNTYTPALIDIPVEKLWDDNNNQDGIRPGSITVYVYDKNDPSQHHIKEITLPQDTQSSDEDKDRWQGIFTGLRKYDAEGNLISYKVGEVLSKDSGYSLTSITGNPKQDGSYDVVLTNGHTPETTDVSVTKIWNDGDYTGITHPSITLKLRKSVDGVNWESADQTVTLPKENVDEKKKWQHTFTGLPVYENGNKISYTVSEVQLDDKYEYESSEPNVVPDGDGNYSITVTNTYKPEFVEIPVEKVWLDGNGENARPKSITITLKKGGEVVQSITLDSSKGWKGSFTGLPKRDKNGDLINYTVGYTVEETVPDGYITEEKELTITQTGGKYDTVTITNTQLTNIDVEKVWVDDNNDEDGMRPEYIIVYLKIGDEVQDGQDGRDIQQTTLNSSNGWEGSFTDLPKYDSEGNPIVYSVVEVLPEDYQYGWLYESSVDGVTITNTYKRETTRIPVTKVWDDNGDQDGVRPFSIKIRLVAYDPDDVVIQDLCREITLSTGDVDLNNRNMWKAAFEELPVYHNGYKVRYEVEEVSYSYEEDSTDTPDYQSKIEKNEEGGYTITNSYTPDLRSVEVKKNWEDNGNQDGVRPDDIWVTLYVKNGDDLKKADVKEDEDNPVKLSKENNWSYKWSDLPKNDDGNPIEYWVEEAFDESTAKEDKENYPESSTEWNENETVITITNTHETEKTDVSVTKEWIDGGNQDVNRPRSITVYLYKKVGGELVQVKVKEGETNPATLSGNDWSYTWSDLPKKEDGKDIEYTVVEGEVEGYESSEPSNDGNNNFTITNTALTDIGVTKVWKGGTDSSHTAIKVKLQEKKGNITTDVAGSSELELNAGNNWSNSWKDLPVYDSDGNKIEYTVEEVDVPEGYKVEVTGNSTDGFNVTNTAVTDIEVNKVWKGGTDSSHTAIKVKLQEKKGNITTDVAGSSELELNAGNNWSNSWKDLPVYDSDGNKIEYTVEEVEVPEGYKAEVTRDSTGGFTVTNTAVTDIRVTKVWVDDNNNDRLRPTSVKVKLQKKKGNITTDVAGSELELNAGNNWSNSWKDLPVYDSDGNKIEYTVEEVEVPEGYKAEVTGDSTRGFTVTNTHTTGKTTVSVEKKWKDGNDQDGKRPSSIKVQLYEGEGANKKAYGTPVELNEKNDWMHTWDNLPLKADGEDIVYSVQEVAVPAYYDPNPIITGDGNNHFTITNTHTLETVDVSGTKTWNHGNNDDPDNQPKSIKINLYKETKSSSKKLVETRTVEAPWSWSFTGLPKYEKGELITYSIKEDEVEGYTSVVNGYNVINTYNESKESPGPSTSESPSPTPTETLAPTETPVPEETPAPSGTPVPSETPAPGETPNPEETPEPTTEEYETPAPAATPVAAPTETPTTVEVLQPRRYQISGTEGMVLGARRGMDYAVLGMRRRPSTGDSVAMLWWLLSLFTALGGCITSGVMMMFNRKRK